MLLIDELLPKMCYFYWKITKIGQRWEPNPIATGAVGKPLDSSLRPRNPPPIEKTWLRYWLLVMHDMLAFTVHFIFSILDMFFCTIMILAIHWFCSILNRHLLRGLACMCWCIYFWKASFDRKIKSSFFHI